MAKHDFFGRSRRSENNIYSSVQVDSLLKKSKAQKGTMASNANQGQSKAQKPAIQAAFQPKRSTGNVISAGVSNTAGAQGRALRLIGERKSAADMGDTLTNEYDLLYLQEGEDYLKKSALISKNVVKKTQECRSPSNELRLGERRPGSSSLISTIKQGKPSIVSKCTKGTQLIGANDLSAFAFGSHAQKGEEKEDETEKIKSARGVRKSPNKYPTNLKFKK